MVAGLVWLCLTAALGQTPGAAVDAAWLKSVPADIDVVAQVRGLEPVHDDLVKMLDATSPALAAQAKPALQQLLDQFTGQFGKAASASPFLMMLRLPKADALGTPPFGVVVKSSDYPSVLKSLAGPQGDAKPKSEGGGVDSIKGSDGKPVFTFKGNGFIAFSNDEFLVRAIAKPKATLESALGASLRSRLLAGDVGLYVNLAAVQKRYGDEIEQFKQQMLANMDNPAQAATNPEMIKAAKSVYSRMFDALKDGQALVLNFDFDPAGLDMTGEALSRPGTDTAKHLTAKKTSTAETLGKLPADLTTYIYFNSGEAMLERLQSWSFQAAGGPGEAPSPEIKKALDMQREADVKEMSVASGLGQQGIKGISVSTYADPKKAIEAVTAMAKAIKTSKSPALAAIKEIKIEPNAQTYHGFTLNRSVITFDPEKFAQQQKGVPNASKMLKAIVGDSLNNWYGTEGKVVVSAVAADWDKAKAEIDSFLTGQGSVGKTASYQKLRAKLPAQVNGLVLVSAQGLIQQITQMLGMLPDTPGVKPAADLPKEPQLLGVAIVGTTGGVQFQLHAPSAAGEVFEKGLAPLLQGVAGKVNQ
ncbi:MAG TPA: hypothetical protein VGZ22_02830 [Isosphaeraceae bacterium]|jgi:hypothetical protein|nr:hypothetical protein [Isosphaeraceae bacterium]